MYGFPKVHLKVKINHVQTGWAKRVGEGKFMSKPNFPNFFSFTCWFIDSSYVNFLSMLSNHGRQYFIFFS